MHQSQHDLACVAYFQCKSWLIFSRSALRFTVMVTAL